MDVAFDVGNSTVQAAFYKDDTFVLKVSFQTDSNKSSDELYSLLSDLFRVNNIDYKEVEYVVYSSVVPSINPSLTSAIKKYFKNAKFLSLDDKVKTSLPMKCDNPSEVGQDLIADMVGAKEKYGYPVLVADLGTASKVLLIDKDGFFSSAVIMPGLLISAQSLFNKGEQLPNVSIKAPKKMFGRNTIDSINIGLIYGHLEMVEGIVRRTEQELGYKCKHILTGGASFFFKGLFDESYILDENLCLDGLHLILNKNRGYI